MSLYDASQVHLNTLLNIIAYDSKEQEVKSTPVSKQELADIIV